jgi:hypothetical protein
VLLLHSLFCSPAPLHSLPAQDGTRWGRCIGALLRIVRWRCPRAPTFPFGPFAGDMRDTTVPAHRHRQSHARSHVEHSPRARESSPCIANDRLAPCGTIVPIVARHILFVVTVPGVCTSPPMLSVLGFVQPSTRTLCLRAALLQAECGQAFCQKSTHISVPPRPYT